MDVGIVMEGKQGQAATISVPQLGQSKLQGRTI
jgi:hypothetical protein